MDEAACRPPAAPACAAAEAAEPPYGTRHDEAPAAEPRALASPLPPDFRVSVTKRSGSQPFCFASPAACDGSKASSDTTFKEGPFRYLAMRSRRPDAASTALPDMPCTVGATIAMQSAPAF